MGKHTQINKGKIVILALILLVPGFLYVAVNRFGSNEYISLPIFGEKQLSGEMKRNWGREYPDTIYHTVPNIDFVDDHGGAIRFPAADSCITVAHLFYTNDEAFSRLLLQHVDALATRFQGNPLIRFYSISVDPVETPASMRQFARDYTDRARRHWHLVSQPSTDIFTYSREQLLIDAMVDPADSSRFLISSRLVLLDSKRRIRGFYEISQKSEIDRLKDELKLLSVEEVRNRPMKIEQNEN